MASTGDSDTTAMASRLEALEALDGKLNAIERSISDANSNMQVQMDSMNSNIKELKEVLLLSLRMARDSGSK